eukprot:Unigene7615_Nuclearia_a/m.23416 Unigene7615_Nuclearia_a/g.23416  ORF Unigene7615_Nuclearia_a/g.23416 Unigene7615_Nuclearia_a/m.23416 type:complete len:380 (-) Unigene7615_Nuclearia_a:125-1264(-)
MAHGARHLVTPRNLLDARVALGAARRVVRDPPLVLGLLQRALQHRPPVALVELLARRVVARLVLLQQLLQVLGQARRDAVERALAECAERVAAHHAHAEGLAQVVADCGLAARGARARDNVAHLVQRLLQQQRLVPSIVRRVYELLDVVRQARAAVGLRAQQKLDGAVVDLGLKVALETVAAKHVPAAVEAEALRADLALEAHAARAHRLLKDPVLLLLVIVQDHLQQPIRGHRQRRHQPQRPQTLLLQPAHPLEQHHLVHHPHPPQMRTQLAQLRLAQPVTRQPQLRRFARRIPWPETERERDRQQVLDRPRHQRLLARAHQHHRKRLLAQRHVHIHLPAEPRRGWRLLHRKLLSKNRRQRLHLVGLCRHVGRVVVRR